MSVAPVRRPTTSRPSAPAPSAATSALATTPPATRDGFERSPRSSLTGASRSAAPASLTASAASVLRLSPQELQHSITSVRVGGTLTEQRTLATTAYGSLVASEGTRLQASATGSGMRLHAEPPLRFSPRIGPTVTVTDVNYNFDTGRFSVEAAGPGPDFLYSAAATAVANRALRSALPAAMQSPGYDPHTDPNLVSSMQSALGGVSGGGSADVPIRDVTATASIRMPREIRTRVGDGLELRIARGQEFELSVRTQGTPQNPHLQGATLRAFSGEGIHLARVEGNIASEIQAANIRSITLQPGAQVQAEYTLVPERMISNGVGLLGLGLGLLGAASGDPRGVQLMNESINLPPARLAGVRTEIDGHIRDDVQPALADFIRQYDSAIPGYSLRSVLGVR